MLTANLTLGQIPGERPDPGESLILESEADSFLNSPGRCMFGDDTTEPKYPHLSSGLDDQFAYGGTDLYSFNQAFSSTQDSNPSTTKVSSNTPQQPGSKTPPSTLSSESQPKSPVPPPRQEKSKRKASKQKETLETRKTTAATKTRRQPERESRRSTRTEEVKKPTRRERSLERNRVAASKCRRRKKAWTEKLEEKRSGLEAMHSELQTQYLSLLQESCNLKNHLITHAACHDPNIDVWINNEASKFVRRLSGENPQRPRSLQSLPSLDNNSTWQSSANSHYTGLSESSLALEGNDSNEDDAADDNFDENFGDEMF
ncbi:hypothetical protein C2857_000205 [Epichloe festucae Fl1]|uniref:BZIP domain-containing protein n=1 Tax=Epichloe festucae (strain Fl1) TaxID=877507 RepID=A0A7S9PWH4_EPIFF|nr:hypothetical protein C2857_000205 [Epichloe festucae Fl1]